MLIDLHQTYVVCTLSHGHGVSEPSLTSQNKSLCFTQITIRESQQSSVAVVT